MANKTLAELTREKFPVGARVELVCMDDVHAPFQKSKGTVKYVDDAGILHVRWDDAGCIGVILAMEHCRRIDE